MYSGDDDEATGEDLELERYGLTEGLNSGSGESDTEEALYRQVHYNISNDDSLKNTTEDDGKSYMGGKEELLSTSTDFPTTNREPDDRSEIDLSTADIITSDNDSDDHHNWKRVKSDSKYKVSLKTTSLKTKAAVVVKEDSESDIVFIDTGRKAQESGSRETVKKEGAGNPRKRSWKKMTDDHQTKITKIDRTSWSSAQKVPEAQTSMSETSKVVIIADDSSSSSVIVLDSERSEEEVSRLKQRSREDGGEFFLDNKGMALEDVQRDKDSAELGWKAEKMKTKAMLKEGVEIIDLSSGEEDCMVIESCSEEEAMHVHFDEEGDAIPPEANDSGISKGKRKGREKIAPGRYFVQSRQKHIRCHNCNEMGHLKSECPQPPRIPVCILCGTRGHTDRYCPDALCFNCSLPGHQSKSCPFKRHLRYANCTRCQMPGHVRKMCPDIWRQYHLTTEHGPIIRPTNQHHRTKQKDVYCSNCSQKGHRYYDCHSSRFDEFTVFTYDKVCMYDKKHIGKMVYPAENKNAEYLKLLKERKDEAPLSMTKGSTASITKDKSQPRTSKRKFPEEEERVGKHIREGKEKVVGERETASMSTEREESGKNRILNPVKTFVRTRLFGGKKGKCWAQQDGAVVPSRRQQQQQQEQQEQQQQQQQQQQEQQQQQQQQQQQETEVVYGGGGVKLTKKQKKAQRKLLDAQKKQMAKEIRSLNPQNAARVFAEAKQIKRSASSAINAVKREIRAALKQKEMAEPLPNEVTDTMTKEQKKVLKRKIKKKRNNELRAALRERVRTDEEVGKIDRVFKEARKIFRDVKKRKTEVDRKVRRGQYVPAEGQHPVPKELGYAGYTMSQRGFNLDSHLLAGTHRPDNRRMIPVSSSLDEAFPRSSTSYNDPNFAGRSYSYSPTFAEDHYQYSLAFTDDSKDSSPYFENSSYYTDVNVTCSNRKRNRRKGKRRKKQGGQGVS